MNFKTKWFFGGILISVIVIGISSYLFSIIAMVDAVPYLNKLNDITVGVILIGALFFAPAVAIALPPAIFLPLNKNRKAGWFFGTALTFAPVATLTLIAGYSLGIFVPLLLSLMTCGLTGLALGKLQHYLLKRAGAYYPDVNLSEIAKQWQTQTLKGSLISGAALPLTFAFVIFIINSTIEYLDAGDLIYGIFIYNFCMLSLTLPLTLLTAAPAAQLHEALNKHGIPIEATPLAD